MSNGAQAAGTSVSYRVLRELGNRSQKTFAAVRERTELVVLSRWVKTANGEPPAKGVSPTSETGATRVSAEQMALLLRDARCLAKNWHPNVARVRHADVVGSELNVASELVDGATLEELLTTARTRRTKTTDPLIPHAILARILVDVLGGLHGLHGLRDGIQSTLGCFHGEIAPANVVVGKDGVARIVNCFRPRPVMITPTSEALGYASPETLAGETTQDARSDLYGVGVMLWEALSGERLYPETDPARIAMRQREEELALPTIAEASPFAKLPEIAMRALAFDPALRFRTASEMATEIRRVAGTRLAPGSAVAQCVMELAGDRVKNRRADLDPSSSGSRKRASKAPEPAIKTVIGVPALNIPQMPGLVEIDTGDRPTLEPSSDRTPEPKPQIVVETKDVFVPQKIAAPPPAKPIAKPPPPVPKPAAKPPPPKPTSAATKPEARPEISDASALEAAMEVRVSPRSLVAAEPAPAEKKEGVEEKKEASVEAKKEKSVPPPPITPEPSVVVAPQSDPVIEHLSSASVIAVPEATSEPRVELPPTDPRMVTAADRNTPDELSVSVPPPNRKRFLPLVLGVVGVCAVATLASAVLFAPSKDSAPTTNATSEPTATAAATPAATETTTAAPTETTPPAEVPPPATTATEAPAEDPKPEPVATEPAPTATTPPAPTFVAPRNPAPAAPRPPPKKKTFEPQGI